MGHPQDCNQSKIKDLVKPDIHAELSESSWVSYKNAQRGSICWIYIYSIFSFSGSSELILGILHLLLRPTSVSFNLRRVINLRKSVTDVLNLIICTK